MSVPSIFDSPPLQNKSEKIADNDSDNIPEEVSEPVRELSLDEVQRAVPSHLRHSVTQNLVDSLNNISSDPIMSKNIRDNFIGYTAILKEGKFKTEDYLNAVAYVSYKLMGYNNEESYNRTFPQRYANLIAKGTSKKDIAAYVSAFHRGKLVNLIMEQSLVPTWVLNQDVYQKAINTQVELMLTARSEKVRSDAANSILHHLKKPDNKDFQISLDTSESSGMKEMRAMLNQLAQQQQDLIESGQMKTIDVAASRVTVSDEDDD